MENLVDSLNKVLTNLLGYKEILEKLSSSVTHNSTRDKLKEIAEVKEKESKKWMQLISELGGDIESTERATDQKKVAWISEPLPDPKDIQAILNSLIRAEQKAMNDYDILLDNEKVEVEKMDDSQISLVKKFRQEASANLEYFQSARSAIEKK